MKAYACEKNILKTTYCMLLFLDDMESRNAWNELPGD
jgi:hypothetical protein